jgi:PIN domain nuclease of toxin-antitoxin system
VTYVTDTHPLIWFLEGNTRLSQPARDALQDATAQIVVPTIVLAETTFLYARGRVAVDLPAVLSHIAGLTNCVIYPLDQTVVEHLPTGLDIHDAIIVATALVFRDVLGENTAIVTRDAAIHASALVQVIW